MYYGTCAALTDRRTRTRHPLLSALFLLAFETSRGIMAEQKNTASEPAGVESAVQAGSPKSQTSSHRGVDISSETQNALAQDPLQADDVSRVVLNEWT